MAGLTADADYPAGAPLDPATVTERPSVMAAARAVEEAEEAFTRTLRAGAMALLFQRRKREGGIPTSADVADYEAMLRVLERPEP